MSLQVEAQEVKVISFKDFQSLTEKNDDVTYVYNFWATWCIPCVKEIPDLEKISSEYSKNNVKVIFICMDFKKDLESRVKPFIISHKMRAEVYLLSEPDYNSWIDKVDNKWSGGIPATLIINHNKKFRKFFEQPFTFDELEKIIKPIINL
jgi:thiol-disulfide isomerase/thioredoxin